MGETRGSGAGDRPVDPIVQSRTVVLDVLAENAEALLRTARRNSVCIEDAQDAYQRAMEVFMRRAPGLRRDSIVPWLHTVVLNEARDVRARRLALLDDEGVELEHEPATESSDPYSHALSRDRTARVAEALRRLKPDEVRVLGLHALGLTYGEISAETGFSWTKVNRCMAEGRARFLECYAGIESGAECGRVAPLLSAIVDGEAASRDVVYARSHVRNCPSCRSSMARLREVDDSLAAFLPASLVEAAGRVVPQIERLLGSGGDVVAGAGSIGLAGGAAAKALAVLAVGGTALTVGSPPGRSGTRSGTAAPIQTVSVPATTPVPQVTVRERQARFVTTPTPARSVPEQRRPARAEVPRTPSAQALAARELIPPRAVEPVQEARSSGSGEFTP